MKAVFRFISICFLAFGNGKSSAQVLKKDTARLAVHLDMPRFLREGDRLELTAKITNLSGKEFTGQALLQLFDATTNTSVDGWFQNVFPVQYFTVDAGETEAVSFPVEVPYLFKKALLWRITATAENGSDSESAVIPILTTKALITEKLALPIDIGVRNYTFKNLLQSDGTEHQSLTVELFQNPIWHVLQALPQLAKTQDFNAEQVWNRFFAYTLAERVRTTSPGVAQTIDNWKTRDTIPDSYLLKDENLFSEETPWLFDAASEEKQKLAAFFNTIQIKNRQNNSLEKLRKLKYENGGFAWFYGGPYDRFITQNIVTGIGHLKKLDAIRKDAENNLDAILQPALSYLDKQLAEDYQSLLNSKINLEKKQIGSLQVQYLYLRSFFTDIAMPAATLPAWRFYQQQAQRFWKTENNSLQAMIALALRRNGDKKTPAAILQSLKQKNINSKKVNNNRTELEEDAIEEKTLLIEAFREINNDQKTIETFARNLIRSKELNGWRTAKATASACYALLLQPVNWLDNGATVQMVLGNTAFSNRKQELSNGYFKKTIDAMRIQPEMGKIQVAVQLPEFTSPEQTLLPATVYWQYFQDTMLSTFASIKIDKKLFIKRVASEEQVTGNSILHVGDTLFVRLSITAKNELHYVHLKDGYAAALKPVNGENGYKSQGHFNYFQTNRTAGMNFFLPVLQKGISVLEYKVLITHAGTFNNGKATVEIANASQPVAHSEALLIQVE